MIKFKYLILFSLFLTSCYQNFSDTRRPPKPVNVKAVNTKDLSDKYSANDYKSYQDSLSLSQTPSLKSQPWEFWPLFLDLENNTINNHSIITGDEYTKKMRYTEALESYLEARGYSKSLSFREALVLRLSSTELSLGRAKAALSALSSFTRRVGMGANDVNSYLSLMFAFSYSRLRDFDQGLAWFSRAHQLSGTKLSGSNQNLRASDSVSSATDRGLKLLLETLSDETFNQVRSKWRADTYINSYIGREASRRLSGGVPKQKNGFWHIYKPTTFSKSAARDNELAKIAVLLPFKGKFAPLGSSVKNGFELALDGLSLRNRISVSYYDTNGDAVIAAAVARSLINSSGAVNPLDDRQNVEDFIRPDFVIGPLLSETSSETSQIFSQGNIPQLAFSKQADFVTSNTTYRLGATVDSQMESLVEAIDSNSIFNSVALIYPNDGLSRKYASIFRELLYKKQGNVVYEVSYEAGSPSSFVEVSKELRSLQIMPKSIFFPDSLHMASKLLIALPENIRSNIKLLGTVRWDNDEQLARSKTLFRGIIFPNPFFEQSKNKFITQFVKTYLKTYKQEPGFLAAQGFDAGTLVLNAVLDSRRNNISILNAFSNIEAYSGLTGEINFGVNGELKRKFKVVELTSKGLKELK